MHVLPVFTPSLAPGLHLVIPGDQLFRVWGWASFPPTVTLLAAIMPYYSMAPHSP